ncbi:MAG TPA: hypothetical protein VFV99_16675 [Kofleriaceae bacterium]|nr:hypothetical protein [Kofleriaceae bacterium]
MIALRAPQYLSLGIATVATAAIWLTQPTAPALSAPELAVAPPSEPVEIRTQSTQRACDSETISGIVIRGQFTSFERLNEGFTISFAGTVGRYTTMTDAHGYFEVHIPRDDFNADLCQLVSNWKSFSDADMSLKYRLDFE